MNAKTASYIGLAQRAGAVLYGEDIIAEHRDKVKLVLIDGKATDKYKDRLNRRLSDIKIYILEGLQDALHREGVFAVGIVNGDLADAISGSMR